MTKNLTSDFGNCTLSYVGEAANNTYTTGCIDSTYSTAVTTDNTNVVTCNNVTIQLGARGSKALEFTNVNKVEREYLEHQILWCVYKAFGSGNHHIKFGTGMPLVDYLNIKKQNEFMAKLKSLGTISGEVEGRPVTATIIPDSIQLFGECHAALKSIAHLLSKEYANLIVDIGLKTTDITIYEWVGDRFQSRNNITIPTALDSILTPIQAELELQGAFYKLTEINRMIAEKRYIVRTEQGDYDLQSALKNRFTECVNIIKEIENRVGKTLNMNKCFIGGGSEIFLDIVGPNRISNNIHLSAELRYYANVLGYYFNLA